MHKSRSPLRYPGGKQKLSPFVKEILDANGIQENYVEPYAGGAGVGLELLLSNRIKKVHLNDIDYGIYCFWSSILNRTEEFCKLIYSASLTVEEWQRQKHILKKMDKRSTLAIGFSTFFLNRCNRSGVISGGLIGGKNQTGNYKMNARFTRSDLIKRIEAIAMMRDRIFITNMDTELYIDNYLPNLSDDTLIYFDPPYYNKGSQLYLNAYKKGDHARLAHLIQTQVDHRWILSYDGVPEIIELYNERRSFVYDLQYSVSKPTVGKEVFIFSDAIELPILSRLPQINSGLVEIL